MLSSTLITDTRFNNKHPIRLELHRYAENNNICLRGVLLDPSGFEEPFCTYTTCIVELPLPDDRIALKTWSEGRDADYILIKANIIEPDVIDCISTGFVLAPVYKLTEEAMQTFELTA